MSRPYSCMVYGSLLLGIKPCWAALHQLIQQHPLFKIEGFSFRLLSKVNYFCVVSECRLCCIVYLQNQCWLHNCEGFLRGHVNVARANPSSCAASCKDAAAKARPCSFLKLYYTIEVACVTSFRMFSAIPGRKFGCIISKVFKNTMLGQGISGNYCPKFF